MCTITSGQLQRETDGYLRTAVEFSEPVYVTSDSGTAVIISETDYRMIMETLHLLQMPGMRERIAEARSVPIEESEDFAW